MDTMTRMREEIQSDDSIESTINTWAAILQEDIVDESAVVRISGELQRSGIDLGGKLREDIRNPMAFIAEIHSLLQAQLDGMLMGKPSGFQEKMQKKLDSIFLLHSAHKE